jgi:thiol:disulfide interchange protein DsbA
MKKLLGAVLFSLSLGLVTGAAQASPEAPVLNTDYTVLAQPQPVSAPAGKIEVTEFFWYGCPHCFAFEPKIEAWAKTKGDDVVFRRVPVAFRPDFEPHSRMYHALDSMGIAEQLTPKVFNEIHVNKDYLLTPEAQAKFLGKNGVDTQKYLAAYNSFGVISAVKRDTQMLTDYKIDGVPTVVIQGKYETSPAQTNSLDGTITVINWLDAQIRAKKM